MGRQLDAIYDRSFGPYRIGDESVRVSPAFGTRFGAVTDAQRQATANQYAHRIKQSVGPEVYKSLGLSAARATSTRGSLEDIRKVTQALIDSPEGENRLRGLSEQDAVIAVRRLMADHGVGLDCRGYALNAFLAARTSAGAAARHSRYGIDRGGAIHQGTGLRRVPLSEARTGDLIRVTPDKHGRDHNVILRAKRTFTVPAGSSPEFMGRQPSSSFLTDAGGRPVRITALTVDGSWGDSGSPDKGGVQRRVWLHNETTGQWGYWDLNGEFGVSKGPYAHPDIEVYRPREEK